MKSSPKAWSRSEYTFARFAHWQKFWLSFLKFFQTQENVCLELWSASLLPIWWLEYSWYDPRGWHGVWYQVTNYLALNEAFDCFRSISPGLETDPPTVRLRRKGTTVTTRKGILTSNFLNCNLCVSHIQPRLLLFLGKRLIYDIERSKKKKKKKLKRKKVGMRVCEFRGLKSQRNGANRRCLPNVSLTDAAYGTGTGLYSLSVIYGL